jgi:hypothetical protein
LIEYNASYELTEAGWEERQLPVSAHYAPVFRLQEAMLEQPQIDPPVKHYFGEGLYVREMRLHAGELCVGKIHKKSHVLMLMEGRMSVFGHEGPKAVEAPYLVESPAWTKRAMYAITDCILVTAHATEATDLSEIEAELIEPEQRLLT